MGAPDDVPGAHADDDRALVRRVLAGDQPAFERLVARCEPLVRHLAQRMLRDPRDRDELVQDVFLRVWRGLHRFAFEAKLTTWVGRIAYRRCLTYLERRGEVDLEPIGPDDLERQAGARDPDGGESPLARLERAELHAAVREEVLALPAVQRAVVSLHYLDGLPVSDVAEVMEMPDNTVKSHLFRARRTLRARLTQRTDGGL
jgi:RNA polymerase sigma-70 factor (ECF subfamily)